MTFISSLTPPQDCKQRAWWFIFQEDALLVRLHDNHADIPYLKDIADFHLKALRTQYLGTLDATHCYTVEIAPSEATLPDGWSFHKLRALFEILSDEMFPIAGRAFQIMNWDRTHQYCGRCGSPTEQVGDEHAKVCPECKLTQYPRVSPAIIVAVVKDQQILLAHAPRFPKGLYSVVAGFVEAGETFEDCIRREVKEEVGIEVKDIRYFGSQPWAFPHSLMVGFTAKYAGGEIRVDNHEILDANWFTADKLPKIPGKFSIARRLIDWFVAHHSDKQA
jgi:NAD+ diphosphatase